MGSASSILFSGISFGRNVYGLLTRPYETYRRIASAPRVSELLYIAAFATFYFVIASLVRVATFRPFLLTKQFVVLSLAAGVGYMVMVSSMWIAAACMKVSVRLSSLAVSWGYSLLPTIMWFFSTSVLYLILPPPRTTTVLGVVFSLLFLVFSVTLLWWKIMMAYLTVRFVMKANLIGMTVVGGVVLFSASIYSILLYRMGIFRVPFL